MIQAFPALALQIKLRPVFKSQLNNVELNVLRLSKKSHSWPGFRFVNLSDNFNWQTRRPDIAPEKLSAVHTERPRTTIWSAGSLVCNGGTIRTDLFSRPRARPAFSAITANANGFIKESTRPRVTVTSVCPMPGLHDRVRRRSEFHTAAFICPKSCPFVQDTTCSGSTNVAMSPDRLSSEVFSDEAAPLYMHRRVFMHGGQRRSGGSVVKSLRAHITALVIALATSGGLRAANAQTFTNAEQSVSGSQPGQRDRSIGYRKLCCDPSACLPRRPIARNRSWDVIAESLFLWRDNHTPSWSPATSIWASARELSLRAS